MSRLLGLCLGLLCVAPADALRSRYDDAEPTIAPGPNSSTIVGASPTSHPQDPGFGLRVTQSWITEVKELATPFVIHMLRNLSLKDLEFDFGSIENVTMTIHPPEDPASINLTLIEDGNAVDIAFKNISATLRSNFTYSVLFVETKGEMDMNMKQLGLHVRLNLSTQKSNTTTAELAPRISVDDLYIDIDANRVDVDLKGGPLVWLTDKILFCLKHMVIPLAKLTWRKSLSSLLGKSINKLLASRTQVRVPYLDNVTFDFAQVGPSPSVSRDGFFMSINGTFFDAAHVTAPKFSPAAFIAHEPKEKRSSEVDVFLTDYVLNTALASVYTAQETFNVTAMLKWCFNKTAYTDFLEPYLPGVVAKYGSGRVVDVSARLTQGGGTAFYTPTVQTMNMSLLVTGKIDDEVVVEAEFVGISLVASFRTDASKVYANATNSSLGKIRHDSFHTTLDFNEEWLLSHLQGIFDGYVAKVAHGLVVPTFFGANVSNFDIGFFDGYVRAGFSFSDSVRDAVRKMQPVAETEH